MHDDGFAAGLRVSFHFRAGANVHFSATRTIGLFNAAATVDDRSGREVRAGNMFHQPFNADVFVFNVGQTAVDHFGQVVRRNIGRHTYRDTGRTVD